MEGKASKREARAHVLTRERTPEELAVLTLTAKRNGWDWVNRHANLVLNQARAIGNL